FGTRRMSGIWPPSKPTGTVLRALVPLVPRPAVLPLDASPRPLRVLALLAPGAGRRSCTLRGVPSVASAMSVDLLDGDQVRHRPDHAAHLGAVLADQALPDLLQAEGAQRVTLVLLLADHGLLLRDPQVAHDCA